MDHPIYTIARQHVGKEIEDYMLSAEYNIQKSICLPDGSMFFKARIQDHIGIAPIDNFTLFRVISLINEHIEKNGEVSLVLWIAYYKLLNYTKAMPVCMFKYIDIATLPSYYNIFKYDGKYHQYYADKYTHTQLESLMPYLLPLYKYKLSIESFHEADFYTKMVCALLTLNLINGHTLRYKGSDEDIRLMIMLDPIKILRELFLEEPPAFNDTQRFTILDLLNPMPPLKLRFGINKEHNVKCDQSHHTPVRDNYKARYYKSYKKIDALAEVLKNFGDSIDGIGEECPVCFIRTTVDRTTCCNNILCPYCKEHVAKVCPYCRSKVF